MKLKINQMKLKNGKKKTKQKDLIYKRNKYKYYFQQYETIRSFGESIYAGYITAEEIEEGQSSLLKNIVESN